MERPKEELLRFVIGPDGEVVVDVEGRLPGRGIWLSAERDMVNTAIARKVFARAARKPVSVPDDLADRVERLLVRRCLDLIGLARRAGQAVAGFERAREWIRAGRAGLVLAAADGESGGRAKIRAMAPKVPVLSLFRSDELGAVFGRQRAVHLVLAPGRLAESLIVEARRLGGFREIGQTDVFETN